MKLLILLLLVIVSLTDGAYANIEQKISIIAASYDKDGVPIEHRCTFYYDANAQSLEIKEPYSNADQWDEGYNKRGVLVRAKSRLIEFALSHMELHSYRHIIYYRDRELFRLSATKGEIAALRSKLPIYQFWLDSQPDPYEVMGRKLLDASDDREKSAIMQDASRESERMDLQFYDMIFSHFKDMKLDSDLCSF
ncbi:MAG: hypothetical protein MOGMAGMI_01407 [Candidatus Omnitrophica bacterium]|nr:hypothetical protein [Candidatus Omnitrophota bacterium]